MASTTGVRLMDLITQAGFTGASAATMYAITLAESKGDPLAHNTNAGTGDNSYGLAQINMIGALGPARRAQFNLASNDDLFDPLTNLRVAYAMSNGGTNFTPWSTFNRGEYRQYMGQSNAIIQTSGSASSTAIKASSLPPAPYPVDKDHKVTINGTVYDSFNHPETVPPDDAVTMAHYLRKVEDAYNANKHNGDLENAYVEINHGVVKNVVDHSSRSRGDLNAIVIDYVKVVRPLTAMGPFPGSGPLGSAVEWAQKLGDIFAWFSDAHNWRRIGIFTLGALIIIFTVSRYVKPDLAGQIAQALNPHRPFQNG